MSARIALLTVVLAAVATLPRPAAAGPWGLAPGEWYSTLEGSLLISPTSYDLNGTHVVTGRSVEQRAMRFYQEIGRNKHLTILMALPAMSVTSRDEEASSAFTSQAQAIAQAVKGTATGFQDVLIGARWSIKSGPTALALQIDWSAPSGYNRNLDSLGLQLGDGLQQLSGEFQFGRALSRRGFLQASVGERSRYLSFLHRKNPANGSEAALQNVFLGEHPGQSTWAEQLVTSADLGVWLSPSLLAGGRYRGVMTLSRGLLHPDSDVQLAGPLLLYRVDDRLDMFAGSWSTVSGKNTLYFNQVYAGMAFHKTKLNRLQGFLGSKQAP